MNILRKIYTTFIAISIFCCMCCTPSFAASAPYNSDPVVLLNRLSQQILNGLHDNKTSLVKNHSYTYNLAYSLITPHLSIDEMTQQVLPVNIWKNASTRQLKEFQKQFLQLIIYTYASALSAYKDQAVNFYPVRGGYENKQQITVPSIITTSKGDSPIAMEYKLLRVANTWKIYDMSIAGISVMDSFKSQFADTIRTGDIDSLITKLVEQNNKIRNST